MRLPFTHDEFLDVFGAYNTVLWPLEVTLWLLTATVLWLLASRRRISPLVAGLLAIHWLASGAAYHLYHFRPINPAAVVFGIAFLLQAVLFLWFGVVRSALRFEWGARPRQILGIGLITFAMAYPVLVVATGLRWPRLPLFAVPCPTTLLTAGCLLMAPPGQLRALAVIPILWSLIAGSAAFVLGVTPDLMLLVAGGLLLIYVVAPRLFDSSHAA